LTFQAVRGGSWGTTNPYGNDFFIAFKLWSVPNPRFHDHGFRITLCLQKDLNP